MVDSDNNRIQILNSDLSYFGNIEKSGIARNNFMVYGI